YFEYLEAKDFADVLNKMKDVTSAQDREIRVRVEAFVDTLHRQAGFATPPLYLPEITRQFAFTSTQPVEMIDKLRRILRIKQGQYVIHFRKGDLRPQTRMSMVRDLARIILEGERERFPELGPLQRD